MSNQEPDFEKSKKWHWIPLAGIAAAVAFALFAALYEDASDEPLNDAANEESTAKCGAVEFWD